MPLRMLEYYGILYRKYKIPIISLIICPFRTSIADPPLRIVDEDGEILIFKYRVTRLWKEHASKYISDEDQAYIVRLPDWERADRVLGPVTHGNTYEEALRHGLEALDALIASAHKHQEILPEPQVFAAA